MLCNRTSSRDCPPHAGDDEAVVNVEVAVQLAAVAQERVHPVDAIAEASGGIAAPFPKDVP